MAVLPPDPVFYFKSDMGHIHSICFSIKGGDYVSHLLAATEKGTVYFWDLNTNRLQHKQDMGHSIQTIHCYGDSIITQEKCGSVKLWEVENGCYEVKETCDCNGGFCKSLIINDNLFIPQEKSIDITDVTTFKKRKELIPSMQNVGNLMALEQAQINNKTYILGGYETGDIILWDTENGKVCSEGKLKEQITSLTFDPVNSRGICGNSSSVLQVFSIDKISLKISPKCEVSITNEGCNVVKLRQDNKIFVSGGWDGRLHVFSWKSLRKLVVLNEHKGAITDVKFSSCIVKYWNSRIMAASGADGTITLWKLYN